MKKQNVVLFTCLVFIVWCCVACASKTKEDATENDELIKFMLGTWYSEKEIGSDGQTYLVRYEIEFVDGKTLRFSKSSELDGFKDEFNYQFIDSETMLVENARAQGGQWRINRTGENLSICIWSNDNCLTFTKVIAE